MEKNGTEVEVDMVFLSVESCRDIVYTDAYCQFECIIYISGSDVLWHL